MPPPVLALTRRQRYELVAAQLVSDRASFLSHWQELADYFFPRRTRFLTSDRNRGERRSSNVINSTPRYAARTLQSGMHAGLTSPARPWFTLSTPDPELNKFGPVKSWLHEVTQRLRAIFVRSNLYQVLPTMYGDIGVFATGALGILDDDEDLLRGYSYPLGSFAIGVDERGVASIFSREFVMTVRQVVTKFGVIPGTTMIDWSRISLATKQLWDEGNTEKTVEVCWVVMPNDGHDSARLYAKDAMKWRSCYFEKGRQDDDNFLHEGGFRQFPFIVPRWDVTGEDSYGTDSPGMTTLGDAKGLQILERRGAQAVDKGLAPALVGPSALQTQKVSLLPSDITYDDAGARGGTAGLRPIFEVKPEFVDRVEGKIRQHEYRINKGFFVDLFQMLSDPSSTRGAQPLTAEEVRARQEEKLLGLGPVLERMNDEAFDPLIDRSFSMAAEKGMFPPPPRELLDLELKVEYTSILAQAQKLLGVVGQDRFLSSVGALREAFPEVTFKVRVFTAVDNYGDALGVDPNIIRPDDEAQELWDAERQAAAAAQQAEVAQRMASAGQALGNTPLGGGTALDAVLGGAPA